MQLADNTQISPVGSQWEFTICSIADGRGSVCFSFGPLTISGPSQNITTQANAAALPLSRLGSISGVKDASRLAAGDRSGNANANFGTPFPGILRATNPQTGSDRNDRRLMDFTCTTDSTTSNPNFSDENCVQITENVLNGEGLYGSGTNAKKTFLPLAITGNFQGSGQKFALQENVNCYTMSDCNAETKTVQFAGGPIAGDESQGFQSVSYLEQQGSLTLLTLNASPTTTTCNTTLTQAVTASATAQTVRVASTAGCHVNDWVVIGQEAPTATPNESAMQITAVGTATLTGVIVGNYANGTTVTPGVKLFTSGSGALGQDRVVVNLSDASYSTGKVNSISGGGFKGSGTNWSTGMVDGNSNVVVCVELAADRYTGATFNGTGADGPLNSWYQILPRGLTSTNLGIMTTSVAGDASYHGYGPGSGAYVVRPCAKILRVLDNNNVVLESNSFTWTNGDRLEEAITPYPDVTGYQNYFQIYTAGGTRRSALLLRNTGARTMGAGISLSTIMQTGSNADRVGWGTGFTVDTANVGFSVGAATSGVAYQAFANNKTALSQTPCYAFGGMNIANAAATYLPAGLCANGNTGGLFFNYGTSTPNILNLPSLPGGSATYGLPADLKATPTLTYTRIAAQTCQEQVVPISGATTSMIGAASPRASLGNTNLSWSAWVSASGRVSVRICNPTGGVIAPNAVVWNVAALVP
jgi:hypothetical protein